jgi:hypothetical protein
MNQVSDIDISLRENFNTVNRISEVGIDAFINCEESHNSLATSDDTNEIRISAGNAKESSIKLDNLSHDAMLASEHAYEKVPLNE